VKVCLPGGDSGCVFSAVIGRALERTLEAALTLAVLRMALA